MRFGLAAPAGAAALVLISVLSEPDAHELELGATADGRPYVSGGIGLEERAALAHARPDFSLRVATAKRGTGAYLADARVRILDSGGRTLLECDLAGPILLVDLAPGPYVVEAAVAGQTRRRQTTIPKNGGREIYFYFDVPAGVAPENAPEPR